METASRLFREQGTRVSVADLMKASGPTHGGFYKQFTSKEALIGEATAHAFDELARLRNDGLEQHAGQRDAAQQALIDTTEGVSDFAEWLTVEDRDGITRLCTMLGALIPARATKDPHSPRKSSPPRAQH
ncbi:hypothetical protein Save01_03524 [Streptomyces avermitilis]|uniref:TetR-family transcriptional regulator n=2 Tax=Streptomyces avermitilis TaxID=33903 RepID=Q82LF4_STRAW|nr:putative TetR-family transcriptional regulator [Streptomyces avermitilis MA-4680 = NBRC 14893]BBJ49812.1 TetR family transcriptional regulator [Streptomyces avermitilis]GDY61831.1 TetR family transcriptional regulator [Streptomyces avermitilis]GDY78063.1 TetR family transcriptional regulator [Streptomyces avermitilis]GDY86932.1 TetR family transcriptional regulator [Streptomyces avermitilis]